MGLATLIAETPEELVHIPQYALVGYLVTWTASTRVSGPRLWALAVLTSGAVGCGDEVIQYFLPNRVFDWHDLFFNVGASSVGVLLTGTVWRVIDGVPMTSHARPNRSRG